MHNIRVESKNGEYHVIVKFIEELHVFSRDDEKEKFIDILKTTMREYDCIIFNHVEMLNHSHFMIRAKSLQLLASTMISINTKFAKYYNKLHERHGRVFSKRFSSWPIDDEMYFFSAFRYILRNPVKAKIKWTPWEYRWSAASNYLNKNGEFYIPEVLERFEKFFLGAIFNFQEYIGDTIEDQCIFDINRKLYYDSAAKKIFKDELKYAGIPRLDPESNPNITGNIVLRLRHIGLTYVQLKKFSSIPIIVLKSTEKFR